MFVMPGDRAGRGVRSYSLPRVILQDFIVSTPVPTVFLVIPSGFVNMEIQISGRSDTAANDAECRMQFNGDTGATSYSFEQIFGAATVGGVQDNSQDYIRWAQVAAANSTAGYIGVGSMMIFDYLSTSKFKHTVSQTGQHVAASGQRTVPTSGQWMSLAPIVSAQMSLSAGNLTVGSRVRLIGHR